ncbi:hypothetical protein D3C71_25040 [compost metagenome]
MTESNTIVTYAFRDRRTGGLLRVEGRDNTGQHACVSVTHTLRAPSKYTELPIYEQPTAAKAARALAAKRPWYNADYDTPAHGHDVDVSQLELVRREVTETLTPDAYVAPPELKCKLAADKPLSILRRYSGELRLPAQVRTFAVYEMPEGHTLESIRELAKTEAFCVNEWCFHTLVAVCDVPEDYVPDLEGKPGFAAAVIIGASEERATVDL